MRKILVGYVIDGKHSGIDKYLLGVCKVAHEAGIQLDLLTDEVTESMTELLKDYKFGLYAVPSLKNPLGQYKAIKALIEKNGYDAVYSNISESFNCMLPLAAKKCKVPIRMVHSHSSGVDRASKITRFIRTVLHRVFRPIVANAATNRYACSAVAGEWMFGKKSFSVIYNAVDAARFNYNADVRINVRAQLGVEGKITFIHIGNFSFVKNHFYLMDVIKAISEINDDVALVCVGDGPDRAAVTDYAASLGIADKVMFLGIRSDIPNLMSAADAMIFPSRFEGLSVTCIEAQMSGLPIVLSDTLSRETKVSERVEFLPLGQAQAWAQRALNIIGERKGACLIDGAAEHYDLSFSYNQVVRILKGDANE